MSNATTITIDPAAAVSAVAAPPATQAASPSGFDWTRHSAAVANYKTKLDQIATLRQQRDSLNGQVAAATAQSESELSAFLTSLGYDPAPGLAKIKAATAAV